jgi:hypothetical protein
MRRIQPNRVNWFLLLRCKRYLLVNELLLESEIVDMLTKYVDRLHRYRYRLTETEYLRPWSI